MLFLSWLPYVCSDRIALHWGWAGKEQVLIPSCSRLERHFVESGKSRGGAGWCGELEGYLGDGVRVAGGGLGLGLRNYGLNLERGRGKCGGRSSRLGKIHTCVCTAVKTAQSISGTIWK